MYLNLDLLYNTYIYLFPLFYYKDNYGHYEVYSPMTFKSVFVNVNYNWFSLYDYKNSHTSCSENKVIMKFYMQNCTFTENVFYYEKKVYMEKCKPFKLNSENLHFLKSNTRIENCYY